MDVWFHYSGNNNKFQSLESLLRSEIRPERVMKLTSENGKVLEDVELTWSQLLKSGAYEMFAVDSTQDIQMLHSTGVKEYIKNKINSYLGPYGVDKTFGFYVVTSHPDEMFAVLYLAKTLTKSGMIPNEKNRRFIIDLLLREAK